MLTGVPSQLAAAQPAGVKLPTDAQLLLLVGMRACGLAQCRSPPGHPGQAGGPKHGAPQLSVQLQQLCRPRLHTDSRPSHRRVVTAGASVLLELQP